MKCGTCKFSTPSPDPSGAVYCLRYPPTPFFSKEGGDVNVILTIVNPNGWCGEYEFENKEFDASEGEVVE